MCKLLKKSYMLSITYLLSDFDLRKFRQYKCEFWIFHFEKDSKVTQGVHDKNVLDQFLYFQLFIKNCHETPNLFPNQRNFSPAKPSPFICIIIIISFYYTHELCYFQTLQIINFQSTHFSRFFLKTFVAKFYLL